MRGLEKMRATTNPYLQLCRSLYKLYRFSEAPKLPWRMASP
jgi:hypothetical protein